MANGLAGESPDEVTLVLADSLGKIRSFKSGPVKSRPDVADVYKKPGMSNSGFEILMENALEIGDDTITIQGKFKDELLVCTMVYPLKVTN